MCTCMISAFFTMCSLCNAVSLQYMYYSNAALQYMYYSILSAVLLLMYCCLSLLVSSDCILFWKNILNFLTALSPSRCIPRPPYVPSLLFSCSCQYCCYLYLYIYAEYLYRINYVHLQRKQILNVKLTEEIHTGVEFET